MKISFLLISTVFWATACNSRNEQEIAKEQHKKEYETEQKKVIDGLIAKYDIAYNWDTLDYDYSVNYKPVLNSQYQLIDDITINDIYEQDSLEYISIQTSSYPTYYFDFPISKEQKEIISKSDYDLIFVVSITKLHKIKLALAGEVMDSESTSINFENSNDFIGHGKIIEIVAIKKPIRE